MKKNSVRAFIAIRIPPPVREETAALQAKLKRYALPIRWVPPDHMHLTLHFLGDLDRRRLTQAGKAMERASAGCEAMTLAAKGLGTFPGVRRPRVIWCGFCGETDKLVHLHGGLGDELRQCGFTVERRPFRAHLTLGRVKNALPADQLVAAIRTLGGFESERFTVRTVHLYESRLRPRGALYISLGEAGLKR